MIICEWVWGNSGAESNFQGREIRRELQLKVKVLSEISEEIANVFYHVNYFFLFWKLQSPVLMHPWEDFSYNNTLSLFFFLTHVFLRKWDWFIWLLRLTKGTDKLNINISGFFLWELLPENVHSTLSHFPCFLVINQYFYCSHACDFSIT